MFDDWTTRNIIQFIGEAVAVALPGCAMPFKYMWRAQLAVSLAMFSTAIGYGGFTGLRL